MRRQLLLTGILLALSSTAHAQESVLLRVGGQVGQTNHYQTVMNMFVSGGPMAAMGGDTSQPMTRMTMNTTRTLESVTGDTLTFNETVDSAKMESPAMPQMAAMMGGVANRMRGQVTTTKMDGRARIFSAEVQRANGGDAGANGAGGGAGRGRGMGGMGGGNNQRPMFLLPEQPVRIGQTWQDSVIIPGQGMEGPSNLLATYKLDRVDTRGGTRIAVVTMDGTMATSAAAGPQRWSVRGQFQIDLTAGRLAAFDMTMTGTANMQGQEVPVRMVLSQNLQS